MVVGQSEKKPSKTVTTAFERKKHRFTWAKLCRGMYMVSCMYPAGINYGTCMHIYIYSLYIHGMLGV